MRTPNTNIDFYLDIMSPFAYLASHRLVEIAQRFGCSVTYKPIDLARAKLAVGNTGPANREMPVKLKYLVDDLKRWAGMYGLPLGFIGNVNSAQINKGVFYAIQKGCPADYVREAYRLTWGENGAPDDVDLLRGLALGLDWNPSDFLAYIESEDASQAYEDSIEAAISNGVFGVPTMIVDGQMWWGNDRLFMVENYLQDKASGAQLGTDAAAS